MSAWSGQDFCLLLSAMTFTLDLESRPTHDAEAANFGSGEPANNHMLISMQCPVLAEACAEKAAG